jgi:hypothetical protein
MTDARSLPAGFESLEPFVERWALEGTANRDRARTQSSPAERTAFYEAAKPKVAEALALLDRKALRDFDPQEQRLMNLLLSLAHVSLAVELQGPDESVHAQARSHMRITRSPADLTA